ncbi:S1 family peptidase [Streptomyces luomodiensis]|uniref:S1 family peptidase n=1 Tax=Streptomyces luomodiensis TaxID=3026192 RepID=A0ABY9VCX5_9ACTN|nr:S1 family peptidase [Streptomyces sp. SCA4-21]WNF01821.1 S1 family peptidase [Streptomyces sp. SCA4-21]
MKHMRRGVRDLVRWAAVGALVCGGVMVSQAGPGGAAHGTAGGGGSRPLSARATDDVGGRLVSRLGTSRTAGNWIGADGRPVVAVTDDTAAEEVSRAGARAERVRYSMAQLDSATRKLRSAPRVAGTAWLVDPRANRVVVIGDSTVSRAGWSRVRNLAAAVGDEVRTRRTTGSFTTRTAGAAPMFTSGSRCSAGFNVTDGRTGFILTAGHCGPTGTRWFTDGGGSTGIGTTVRSSFPGDDFSLVRYENTSLDRSSVVNAGGGRTVRITGAADPVVGQEVFRGGSTTGLRSGEVTGLDATVNYPGGTVTGLIRTTVCAEPGDSGGPLFAQGVALGVTSGGSGDCTRGGVTFFQPVTEALSALGVTIPGDRARHTDPSAAPAAPGGPAGAASASGASGTGDGVWTLDEVVAYARSLGPGPAVVVVGFAGLLSTLTVRPRRRRRRGYSTGGG